jgi:DNA (cytosine-5)-methyltransferase 1
MNYYNEWDSFAADWLRELIKDGLIPDGEVDNRSIADVRPEDLKEFTQCHFFAGIGGWSRALQLAGWSSDRSVWTGSPPCQSFSTAGKGKGKDDERHLWPVFFNLIRECQPPTVFGEQVAAAIRFGWLDDLQTDFEREGYSSAAVVLPAGGIGAPHKRERLFFVADSHNKRHEWSQEAGREARSGVEHTGSVSMADTKSGRHKQSEQFSNGCSSQSDKRQSDSSGNCESQRQLMADSCGERCGGKEWGGEAEEKGQSERYGSERSSHSSVGNTDSDRPKSRNEAAETAGHGNPINSASIWPDSVGNTEHDGSHEAEIGRSTGPGKAEGGMLELERSDSLFWGSSEVIYCRDGKYRPIPTEPALFPLADGIPNRVGILRGAGNAIVPQAAAEIIKAYLYD